MLKRAENNFDFIRLVSAAMVLIHHSSPLLIGQPNNYDPFQFLLGLGMGGLGVKTFFIISGFLIHNSWVNKKSVLDFFVARVFRIYPAAIIVVLLSALILGPLVTSLSLNDYFNHNITHKYLQNISLYRMYYFLPGVFENNPTSSINGSLWSLSYEFTCYVLLAVLGLLAILKNKWLLLGVFLILMLLNLFGSNYINQLIIPVIGIDLKTLYIPLLYFMSGSLYFSFKDSIKYNTLFMLLVYCIIFITKELNILSTYINIILMPYLIFWLAFQRKLKFNKLTKYGDFSYGLYLYAFPVQQLIVYFFREEMNLFSFSIIALLISLLFGILSWKYIESPALKLRKYLSFYF